MHDVLHDRVIRVDRGNAQNQHNLPDLLAALVADKVDGYPGARAHQEDPFHAFVVQLAAFALHTAGDHTLPKTASGWRQLLEALTPKYPYAWHLIAPTCKQPAFFQPPANSTADWTLVSSPAAIDAIRPVKEFDVKFGPVATVNLDQWMFTIINLQTTTASNSPRYAQTSRMNGGYSSRLFVGVNGRPGQRFVRDVRLLLLHRDEMMSAYAKRKGICLTWLAPWGHVIPKSRLDPWFLDTPRRVRLVEGGAMLTWARGLRTLGEEAGSLTGDPWAPTQKAKTMSVKGLNIPHSCADLDG